MHQEWGEIDAGGQPRGRVSVRGRPAIQVWYPCARAYLRVLRAADGSHYLARCPKCGASKRFDVGPGGTDARMFEIDCGRR